MTQGQGVGREGGEKQGEGGERMREMGTIDSKKYSHLDSCFTCAHQRRTNITSISHVKHMWRLLTNNFCVVEAGHLFPRDGM